MKNETLKVAEEGMRYETFHSFRISLDEFFSLQLLYISEGCFDPKDKTPICMTMSTLSIWHFANCFLGIRSFYSQNGLEKLGAIDSST